MGTAHCGTARGVAGGALHRDRVGEACGQGARVAIAGIVRCRGVNAICPGPVWEGGDTIGFGATDGVDTCVDDEHAGQRMDRLGGELRRAGPWVSMLAAVETVGDNFLRRGSSAD